MSLKLFFIAYEMGGDNLDWFVWAEDRAQAVDLWRKSQEDDVLEPDIVFEVPLTVPPIACVLDWHFDVKLAVT